MHCPPVLNPVASAETTTQQKSWGSHPDGFLGGVFHQRAWVACKGEKGRTENAANCTFSNYEINFSPGNDCGKTLSSLLEQKCTKIFPLCSSLNGH